MVFWAAFEMVYTPGEGRGAGKEAGTSPSLPGNCLATGRATVVLTGDGKFANIRSRKSLQSSDETGAISIEVCACCAPGRTFWDCCISWAFWGWLV